MSRPAAVLALLLCSLPLSAQQPQESLRVSVRLVTVNVRVAQPDGSPLRNLARSDFRLFEDGHEQPISVFEPLNAPMHVALLFDTSASTARDLELLRGAAERFLDEFSAADQFALYQVGPSVERLSAFTSDRKALKQALKRLQSAAGEGTLLHDALLQALRDFHPDARRRALVLFSDGADEGSQATFDDASLTLLRGHGSLFAVLPQLGPRPQPRASASSADGEWVVVFDLTQPDSGTLEKMKEVFLEFLAELQPEARLRLFDAKLYVRPLADTPVPPADAPALLRELSKPQHYGLIPRRPVREKAQNVLVLTDKDRSGLLRIARYFDLRRAVIAVPDRMPTPSRRQLIHLVVHQPAEFFFRPWERRREAARQMQQLADETGGEVWLFARPRELTATFRQVAEQIRSSYTLGYYSNAPPGRYQLRAEVPGRNLVVRSRQLVVTE